MILSLEPVRAMTGFTVGYFPHLGAHTPSPTRHAGAARGWTRSEGENPEGVSGLEDR